MRKKQAIALAAIAALATGGSASGRALTIHPTVHAAAAGAAASGWLFGLTSQQPCKLSEFGDCGVVSLSLGKRIRSVKRLSVGFEADCPGADTYFDGDGSATGVKIDPRSRRFRKVIPFDDTYYDGSTGVGRMTFAGKVNSKGTATSGTFRFAEKLTQQDGSVAACDSGTVKWHARRIR
jgi:hypothetical protein